MENIENYLLKSLCPPCLYGFIISICCFVSSCTSTQNFAIEIQEPAKITFPANVSRIVVVNNAASPADGDFGTECFLNNKEISIPFTIKFDSAIWTSASTLASGIEDEKFFPEVLLLKMPVRTDKDNLEIRPISKTTKQRIYDATDADAIISIDRCLFKYTQKINQTPTGYGLVPYYTFVNTKTEANLICSAYLRGRENSLTTFALQDSLFFNDQVIGDSIELYDIIPNVMIEDAAAYIGEKAVSYFVPFWKTVDRNLYTSYESRMKEALAYAKANKWTDAESIWSELYSQKTNAKAQAYLAHNLAVASEMHDNLNKALEWAQKAKMLFKKDNEQKNTKEIDLITSYISSLKERINNDLLLNKQFGIE